MDRMRARKSGSRATPPLEGTVISSRWAGPTISKRSPARPTGAVTKRRIQLLGWIDLDCLGNNRTELAEWLGCPNGIAECLLCHVRIMIFDTELEDDDLDGPSLIWLLHIPGNEANLVFAKCSDTEDYSIVCQVAAARCRMTDSTMTLCLRLGDLAQYRLYLQEQTGRHEAAGPRAWCALCARRRGSTVGKPGPS